MSADPVPRCTTWLDPTGRVNAVHNSESGVSLMCGRYPRKIGEVISVGTVNYGNGDVSGPLNARILAVLPHRTAHSFIRRLGEKRVLAKGFWYRVHAD